MISNAMVIHCIDDVDVSIAFYKAAIGLVRERAWWGIRRATGSR